MRSASSDAPSFNGAALFQVRKAEILHTLGASENQGFNGAALFQVRKAREGVTGDLDFRGASMGPHSFKCGKSSLSL